MQCYTTYDVYLLEFVYDDVPCRETYKCVGWVSVELRFVLLLQFHCKSLAEYLEIWGFYN